MYNFWATVGVGSCPGLVEQHSTLHSSVKQNHLKLLSASYF